MDPIKGNSLNRSCGDVISSNCVTVPIAIAGTCGPNPTLTQVLTALDSCCNSNAGASPCYTGNWMDFRVDVPASGSGIGFTWTTTNFGASFTGVYGLSLTTGIQNTPQYKWDKNGNLSVRGTFALTITSTADSGFFEIPLTTIPSTCFPANFNKAQSVLIGIDIYPTKFSGNLQIQTAVRGFITLDYPSGILYLSGSYADGQSSTFTLGVFMGGVTINLS